MEFELNSGIFFDELTIDDVERWFGRGIGIAFSILNEFFKLTCDRSPEIKSLIVVIKFLIRKGYVSNLKIKQSELQYHSYIFSIKSKVYGNSLYYGTYFYPVNWRMFGMKSSLACDGKLFLEL